MVNDRKIKKIIKEKGRLQKLKEDLRPSLLFDADLKVQEHIQRALEELHAAELVLRKE